MKRFLLITALALLTVSCGDKGGNGNDDTQTGNDLTVTEGQTNQTTYADETEGTSGVTFVAPEPWTANVSQTTRATVSWLRLKVNGEETYSGGAGTVNLVIEMDENGTSADRKATITIYSGGNDVEINVSQKAKTIAEAIKDGSYEDRPVTANPKIWKIVAEGHMITETLTLSYEEVRKDIYVHGNVIEESGDGTAKIYTTGGSSRYSGDGMVHVGGNVDYGDGVNQDSESIYYHFGTNGYIANGTLEGHSTGEGEWTDEMTMSYDSDGRLTQIVSGGETMPVEWTGGNQTKFGSYTMTYGTVDNSAKCNLDLNQLLCWNWMQDSFVFENIFESADLFGKRSASMVSKIVDEDSGSNGIKDEMNFKYTVNGAGLITKITATAEAGEVTTITIIYK